MKVFPFLIVILVSSSCANREWDLPVPGFFEVVTNEKTSTACPGPEGLRVTIRNLKGSQTTDDDFEDYSVTFTHPATTPLRMCAWKSCEGKGLLLPWSFLEEDDCPISELRLMECGADQGPPPNGEEAWPGPPRPHGVIWDMHSNTAQANMLEGTLYGFTFTAKDPARPITDAAMACFGGRFLLRKAAQE